MGNRQRTNELIMLCAGLDGSGLELVVVCDLKDLTTRSLFVTAQRPLNFANLFSFDCSLRTHLLDTCQKQRPQLQELPEGSNKEVEVVDSSDAWATCSSCTSSSTS